MNQIKTLVTVFLSKVILTATPDNKVWVKQETTEEAKRIIEAAKAAAAPPPPPPEENAQPQMSALMMQRYGLRPGMRPAAPQQAPAPAPKPADTTPVVPNVNLSSQGTWQLEGTKYKLKLQIENAGQASADAALDGERLLVSVQGRSLVFTRLF
jgi:hypothetical protein